MSADPDAATAAPFEGHQPRRCREHRTVGPHRAWCFDCSEWCYPSQPCRECDLTREQIAAEARASERRRNGRALQRILVGNVIMPETTAVLIYDLLHELLDGDGL